MQCHRSRTFAQHISSASEKRFACTNNPLLCQLLWHYSSQALDEKLRFHTFWRLSQEKCITHRSQDCQQCQNRCYCLGSFARQVPSSNDTLSADWIDFRGIIAIIAQLGKHVLFERCWTIGSGFNSEPATEPAKQGASLEISNSQDVKCQLCHSFAQAARGQSASIWKQRDKQYPSHPSCCRPCSALVHTTSESDVVTVWWHVATSWQKKFGRLLRGLGQIQRTAFLENKTERGPDQ